MIYSIKWTTEALISFEDRIAYLEFHWTKKEIVKFKHRVNLYLATLENGPLIAKKGKFKDVYIGSIRKEVSVIYRVKRLEKEIVLISFIDNRQNPAKTKKYK